MLWLKLLAALIALVTVGVGVMMIRDFDDDFARFERVLARREARQAKRKRD